jgi:hypothetical protein
MLTIYILHMFPLVSFLRHCLLQCQTRIIYIICFVNTTCNDDNTKNAKGEIRSNSDIISLI